MEGVAREERAGSAANEALRPTRLDQTGLDSSFVRELVVKTLYRRGSRTLPELSHELALAGAIVEPVVHELRQRALAEQSPGAAYDGPPLLHLTERGRTLAREAMERCAYVGPAPITLGAFAHLVRAQSVRGQAFDRALMRRALHDVVAADTLLDQVGPALHSGRPTLFYGPPGSGKSYVARRLIRALDDTIFLPHAILAGADVIPFFDPLVHRPADPTTETSLRFAEGSDPRLIRCHRPLVVTGGELTLDMLDLHHGGEPGVATAPVQLKASNGMLLIDDLGRQAITAERLFNRWIIPLEERRDYLTDSTGHHLAIPFETVLLFSTNIDPGELADEAFLRRLGNKIRFTHCSAETYRAIWERSCRDLGIAPHPELAALLIERYYAAEQRPMAQCQPRDLIQLALGYQRYRGQGERLTPEAVDWAWHNYFVQPTPGVRSC